MRPTTRPPRARTRRPSSSSTRHSAFLSATHPSGNLRAHALLEPVLPDKRSSAFPRDVNVHVDSPTHEVVEEDPRRTLLMTWFEFRPKPVGKVPDSMMHAAPRGRLTDFHRDHTRRTMFTQGEDDPIDLADFTSVGIDHLLVENVACQRQWLIPRAPPAESQQWQ